MTTINPPDQNEILRQTLEAKIQNETTLTSNDHVTLKHVGIFKCSKTGVFIKDKCTIGKDLCPAHTNWLSDEINYTSNTNCLIEDYKDKYGKDVEFGLQDVVSIRNLMEFASYINQDSDMLRDSYTQSVEFVRQTAMFMKELESANFEKPTCKKCKDALKNVNHDCASVGLQKLIDELIEYYKTVDSERLPFYVLQKLLTKNIEIPSATVTDLVKFLKGKTK